jgi:hypothetical protein
MFLIPFTTTVELVGPEWKTFWGNMSHVPFALGEALVRDSPIVKHYP